MASSCSRGFSFMCEPKSDLGELKFIRSSELERTWKTTIRERQRVQEKRIWEEFCEKEDVLQGVFQDDPYQFLKDLPNTYLLDQSDKLQESDRATVTITDDEDALLAGGDTPPTQLLDDKVTAPTDNHTIKDISEVLQLGFNVEQSDVNCETIPEIQTPCTVREYTEHSVEYTERSTKNSERSNTEPKENDEVSEKEVCPGKEHVQQDIPTKPSNQCTEPKKSSAFEANVYFEKVKDLRFKINEVLLCIIELLQDQMHDECDPIEMKKMLKRANEFSARFSRIYVYQLQRQLNDLQRHMSQSLPFAKRTQFQAQAARVVSLYQNTLQAFQVFHRPLEKAVCLGDGTHLQALLNFVREASAVCCEVVPSSELKQRAHKMYNDEVLTSCNIIERLIKRHLKTLQVIVESAEYASPTQIKKKPTQKVKQAKRAQLPYGKRQLTLKREGKISPKYGTGTRLSMYSLDNMRLDLKPAASRNNRTLRVDKGTDKPGTSMSLTNVPSRSSVSRRGSSGKAIVGCEQVPGGSKLTDGGCKPREGPDPSRRPLMRDARRRPPARKRNVAEEDIQTMVESVRGNSPRNKLQAEKITPSSPKSPKTLKRDTDLEAADGAGSCDVTALRRPNGGEAKETPGEAAAAEAAVAVANRPANTNSGKATRVTGARNAQLVCVRRDAAAGSPRLPRVAAAAARFPQPPPPLLEILEESLQKQPTQKTDIIGPKAARCRPPRSLLEVAPEKALLQFNIPQKTSESIVNYRTQFVQYMMASPMYANSVFKKPWETVGRVSEEIIEELLLNCALEMQIESVLQDMCQVAAAE